MEDFGIYNVVSGVVLMFSFLTSMLTSASQRFFSYEIGKEDNIALLNIFRLNITIFFVFILLVFLIAESIGLYFINTQLIISNERMIAANWTYQFAILSFACILMTIPFNALIVSYERMNAFAYISVIEVLLKLGLVFLLNIFTIDKLILYSVLMFIVHLLILCVYIWYVLCKFHVSYSFYWNTSKARELISFTGWHILGTSATVARSQGINILLNMFFDPTVNAARAIAYQVNSAVTSFSNNFFTAVKPQIYKYYSQGDTESMLNLVFLSSRFSYYLLLLLGLPIFYEADFVLSLWLKTVPEYSEIFLRLVIINMLLDSTNAPMTAASLATGNIKWYQIVVSICLFMNIPISYVLLNCGYSPEITMIVSIMISFFLIFVRMFMLRIIVAFSIDVYVKNVLFPIFLVSIVSFFMTFFTMSLFNSVEWNPIVIICFSIIVVLLSIVCLGLKSSERMNLRNILLRRFNQ